MKKNKLKNYLKLGILLFGVSLLLVNCEKDYIENLEEESASKLIVRIIDLSDIESNQTVFNTIKPLIDINKNASKTSKRDTIVNNQYGFMIDTDKVKYVENGNYHSYNFELTRENPEDDKLENLFLTLNADYEYDAFIVKYDFTADEFRNISQEELNFGSTLYTIIDFDSSFLFNGGRMEALECESEWVFDGCIASPRGPDYTICYWVEEITCTGGGGPGPGPSSGTQTSGTTNGGNAGQGGSAGTNGSGGSSTGSNPYSAPTCADCPDLIDYSNECNKIDSLFINNPSLQQDLLTLKGLTGLSTERGKYKLSSTSLIQNMPVGVNAQVDMPIPTGTQQYEMIAHTHNAPASATYSVFSFDDLYGMNQLLRKGKIDTSKFTAFLMTEDGTNYAFTINNPTQFLKVFATKFDVGFDSISAVNRYKMKQKYYVGKKTIPTSKPLIVENSTDNLKDEKLFLDFLKDANMGLSLFEVNDNFDSYEMVTHNTRTDSIVKQNCN